jgi:hypothetical protein
MKMSKDDLKKLKRKKEIKKKDKNGTNGVFQVRLTSIIFHNFDLQRDLYVKYHTLHNTLEWTM